MKKTKIICSIGPSSNEPDVMEQMVLAGMNVARINFSHATDEEKEKVVSTVKEVRKRTGANVAILYDTKGPEFRSGMLENDQITLEEGKTIRVVKENVLGNEERITVNHPQVLDNLNIGDIILLENGLMRIEVISKEASGVTCRIINGGILGNKKSLSVPGRKLDIPYISEKDREDIVYACEHEADYLAISFVSCKEEVEEVRSILKEHGQENLPIICKIENAMGIENLEEILEVSEGIMVARGDLGTETCMETLPLVQKDMIKKCREHGKIAIVATEMLESMKKNARPTRAEISDVANAVLDGTDAVMLSGESTVGKYPVETVASMADICESTENSIDYMNVFAEKLVYNGTDAIVKAVAESANSLNAKLIVVPTMSGQSARLISNLEPKCPILALVSDEKVGNSLTLNYGVSAKKVDFWNDMDEIFEKSLEEAEEFTELNPGDNIIITGGFNTNNKKAKVSQTNLMKIETII